MSLFINSPSYYSRIFGIDAEIYQMCRLIEKNIDLKKYTDQLDSIGITPIVAPSAEIGSCEWKEVKYISLSYRIASISLHIDYSKYVSSTITEKKVLIINNVLNSLRLVKKRLKDGFDYDSLENDIQIAVGLLSK